MAKVIVDKSQYYVIDDDGKIIVPPGRYDYIDDFVYGLARVRSHGIPKRTDDIIGFVNDDWELITDPVLVAEDIENLKSDMLKNPDKYSNWGIIEETGDEVVKCEYDEIWSFKKPGLYSTKLVKANTTRRIYLSDLSHIAPIAPWRVRQSRT